MALLDPQNVNVWMDCGSYEAVREMCTFNLTFFIPVLSFPGFYSLTPKMKPLPFFDLPRVVTLASVWGCLRLLAGPVIRLLSGVTWALEWLDESFQCIHPLDLSHQRIIAHTHPILNQARLSPTSTTSDFVISAACSVFILFDIKTHGWLKAGLPCDFSPRSTASQNTHLSDFWDVAASVNPAVTHRIQWEAGKHNSHWCLQLMAKSSFSSLCLSFRNLTFDRDGSVVHFRCAQLEGLYASRCRTEMSHSKAFGSSLVEHPSDLFRLLLS